MIKIFSHKHDAARPLQKGGRFLSSGLIIENLSVSVDQTTILSNVSLQVDAGSFVSLLGRSGCGKTTLLKTIAGFLPPQSGHIFLDGVELFSLPPHRRGVVVMFQDLRLFPHLSVLENVAFPLRMMGCSKKERHQKALRLLDRVGLADYAKRHVLELSGGQQQRVALVRAFATKTNYLLLDEPFSSLDEALKAEMRSLLRELQREFSCTIVLVTHDKTEALMMSDQVAVMDQGVLLQQDTPQRIYHHPATLAVAQYMGNYVFLEGICEAGTFAVGKQFSFVLQDDHSTLAGRYTACFPHGSIRYRDDFQEQSTSKRQYAGSLPMTHLDYLGDVIGIWVSCEDQQLCFKMPVSSSSQASAAMTFGSVATIPIEVAADKVRFFPTPH